MKNTTEFLIIIAIMLFIVRLVFGIMVDYQQITNNVKIENVEVLNDKLPPNLEKILVLEEEQWKITKILILI